MVHLLVTCYDTNYHDREKLSSGNEYRTMRQLADDLLLVFDNCELYNADGSDIYKESRRQRKDLKKLLRFYGEG